MDNTNLTLPENVVNEIEVAWGKGHANQASTVKAARKSFDEITGYGLKIYWLGRMDKLNPHNIRVFQWVTENFVPEEIQNKYSASSAYEVKFKEEDHNQLLKNTLDKLWDTYIKMPNTGLPAEPAKGFSLKRLFGR